MKFVTSLIAVSALVVTLVFNLALKEDDKETAEGTVADGCESVEPYVLPAVPDSLTFCGERVPLERDDVRECMERELLVNAYWHSNTVLTIKRCGRYRAEIDRILIEEGVPSDMFFLAVAESGLVPNIKSPAGALGFWQIIESTAKELKLETGSEVDERCNIQKATHAACAYLKKNYEILGSWTLVAAAYNGGLNRVKKSMEMQKQNNYYDLLWVEETQRYVFRILAYKLILTNPEKYGFVVDELYKPFVGDTAVIKGPVESLADYAIEHGTTYKQLKLANPWLRNSKLSNPKCREYKVLIPKL